MEIGIEKTLSARDFMENEKLKSFSGINYKGMKDNKLKDVSQQFESLFLNELLKSMRSTVPKDEWLNAGLQQDVFEDMLYNEYSLMMAKQGGIGLSDMIYRYLKTVNSRQEKA